MFILFTCFLGFSILKRPILQVSTFRLGEWKYPWVATKKSFFDGLVCSQKSDFCPHKMERIYEQQACENGADDCYRGTWLQLMWCFRIYIYGGKTRILCGCQKSGILHLTPPPNCFVSFADFDEKSWRCLKVVIKCKCWTTYKWMNCRDVCRTASSKHVVESCQDIQELSFISAYITYRRWRNISFTYSPFFGCCQL